LHAIYHALYISILQIHSHIYTWSVFFFNDTATTEIYALSLHDALPISKISWWRCFKLHPLVCRRMGKSKRTGMECLSIDCKCLAPAVFWIAHYCVADIGYVYAYLMYTTGFYPARKMSKLFKSL